MNRFEHADTPTPSHNHIVAWCATRKLHLYSWLLSSMTFSYFQADYCLFNTSPRQQYRDCVMGQPITQILQWYMLINVVYTNVHFETCRLSSSIFSVAVELGIKLRPTTLILISVANPRKRLICSGGPPIKVGSLALNTQIIHRIGHLEILYFYLHSSFVTTHSCNVIMLRFWLLLRVFPSLV